MESVGVSPPLFTGIRESYFMAPSESAPITPAQIRAARALLDWSQDHLAERAAVGLSTVRDYEKERRGGDVAGAKLIRQVLEDHGVVFLASEGNLGPGVRMVAVAPNVLRRPMKLGRFHALMFTVEWRGGQVEVFISQEALDDLGGFSASRPEADYLALF